MNYVRCTSCGVVWVAEGPGGLDYDAIACRCSAGAEPSFEDLSVERGAYLLGVQHTANVFDLMWASPEWEGQCGMGFAATLSQEIHMLELRALGLDVGRTLVGQNDAAGPPAAPAAAG